MGDDMDPERTECCSSPIGPFICGECAASLSTSCGLHMHMTTNHDGGSYHYDNVIKTAFPKYDTCCATTQTSKQDKLYLKQYYRSRTGKPPKRLQGIHIDNTITDKYIVMNTDKTVPMKGTHAIKRLPFRQKHIPSKTYNFRQTNKTIQFNDNSYVALDRLETCKGFTPSERKFQENASDSAFNMIKTEPEMKHTYSLCTVDYVALVNTDKSHGQSAAAGTDDNTNACSRAVSDDNGAISNSLTVEASVSENVFDGYVLSENQSLPFSDSSGETVSEQQTSQTRKPLKCTNATKRNAISSSDNDATDWSPAVKKKQKRKQIRKRSLPMDSSVPVENSEINNTMDLPYTMDKKPEFDTMVKRRKKMKEKSKKDRKRYMCDTCGQVMPSHQKEAHVNYHLGLKPYICEVCAKSFATTPRLKLHMLVHDVEKGIGKYKCHECGRIFSHKEQYDAHVNMHSGTKPFKCDKCDKTFASMTYMRAHFSKIHTVKDPLSCQICGKDYPRRASMLSHMIAAHSDPKLACKYCNRLFHFQKVRRHHELTHTGEKRFVCCLCKHGFIQRQAYLTHMLKQHSLPKAHVIAMDEERRKNIAMSNVISKYAC